MINNFWVLATPIFAFFAIVATSAFTYSRIMRHGRVFNWPPVPAKSSSPPVIKRGDK